MTLRKKITGFVLLVLAIAGWVWVDYRSWLALGPGGVPYNLAGWALVTWMRLGAHEPFDMSSFEGQIGTADDMMLYSPRNKDERALIEQILQAAVRYAAGDLAQRLRRCSRGQATCT